LVEKVSISPSSMVEGGAIPVDKNLTVKEARFVLFDYQGKAKPTTAARLILVDDDGVEATQHYSAGDPERFVPSQDGLSLVPVGAATSLSKSSNFHLLMANLVSAGFPENKLEDGNINILEGMYAFWIGVPEPKRSGLIRTPEQAARGERMVPVPSLILKLPWEKKSKAPTAKPSATAAVAAAAVAEVEDEGDNITAKAVKFITSAVEKEGGSVTRQKLAVAVFKDLAKDPDRDAVASAIFSPEIQAALLGAGLKIKGETISK
jgi:hypothetical protein